MTDIEYVGEERFGQTLYKPEDIPTGLGRRDWIIEGLKSDGLNVKVTLIPDKFDVDPAKPLLALSDGLKYVDNPLIALYMSHVDIFDYRADYVKIRDRNFDNAVNHLMKFALQNVLDNARIIIVSDEKFIPAYDTFKNVIVIPNGPDLVSSFVKVVNKELTK